MAKLARAEQAVEKYQKKLEEMLELKKQNKDLCDKMDQYLDQIHSLESANKVFLLLKWCGWICVFVVVVDVFVRACSIGVVFIFCSSVIVRCGSSQSMHIDEASRLWSIILFVRCTRSIHTIYFFFFFSQGMATLNKMVEQYKNKAVELETEKFEALSSVQTRDQQVRY